MRNSHSKLEGRETVPMDYVIGGTMTAAKTVKLLNDTVRMKMYHRNSEQSHINRRIGGTKWTDHCPGDTMEHTYSEFLDDRNLPVVLVLRLSSARPAHYPGDSQFSSCQSGSQCRKAVGIPWRKPEYGDLFDAPPESDM